jgi:hypothetical protein
MLGAPLRSLNSSHHHATNIVMLRCISYKFCQAPQKIRQGHRRSLFARILENRDKPIFPELLAVPVSSLRHSVGVDEKNIVRREIGHANLIDFGNLNS